MEIINKDIDGGKPFDFGKTSADYARFRDIYPPVFYQKITDRGLCIKGQRVLDLGTGTGVLPRAMYGCGAKWTGADISKDQIEEARRLAKLKDMNIDFIVSASEDIEFPSDSFDVVTACQCFWYFDHQALMPKLSKITAKNAKLLLLYMSWLPYEDIIANQSERLILKYNPDWSGAGETRKPIHIPDIVLKYFELTDHEEYDLDVRFTRESWHGRLRTCRGIGASLGASELKDWEKEHMSLLSDIAPDEFCIKHYAALAVLTKIK